MIDFDEALARVCAAALPLGKETVAIQSAAGRVLAEPVVAQIASPRSDVSAMDGYAVRDADLVDCPARLQLVGESFAGGGWGGSLGNGQCVRIFTGAQVPPGADRVVMQEEVRCDGDTAIVERHPGPTRYIRARGSDFDEGDQLLPTGRLLDKRAIVTAAAADLRQVAVFTEPRVTILSTGNELAEPGLASQDLDAIPDSVSLGVAALVREWGGSIVETHRLRDDLPVMERIAAQAIESSDLVVVTGGASVGEKDFAKAMFAPAELQLIFSKVSMKPGKPVWLGRSAETLILGLPGNPTSALVTARLLLAPLVAGRCGRDPMEALRWQSAELATGLKDCGPRETFHRARWSGGVVELFAFQDSSAQKVLAEAELLVRQPANSSGIIAGGEVRVLDF